MGGVKLNSVLRILLNSCHDDVFSFKPKEALLLFVSELPEIFFEFSLYKFSKRIGIVRTRDLGR